MYNEHKDTVEELPVQYTTDEGVLIYPRRLDEQQLNSLGLYSVVMSSKPDSRYYSYVEEGELVDNVYTISYVATELPLAEVQARMLQSVTDSFLAQCTRLPVDTGLGFSVDGGLNDLQLFELGKTQGILTVRDVDDNTHTIVLEDYNTIIDKINAKGEVTMQYKWDKKDEVKALATIDECKEYEHYPYDVLLVDENGDPILDADDNEQYVTYYKNKCTDWEDIK